MEVFGLPNLKRHSKSPTCETKITNRHHYYKLPKLKLDTQAFLIPIPEIFSSFFVADRTSIIDVRHFDWYFSKFPYIGPVSDPSPSHLQLPPFRLVFFSFALYDFNLRSLAKQELVCRSLQTSTFLPTTGRKFSSGMSEDLWVQTHPVLSRTPRSFNSRREWALAKDKLGGNIGQ